MRNYREKLGRTLVALFFALPLITTPVYANDTIPEPGTDPGSEWSGEIVDPTPAPTPAPTPEPTPAPAPTPEPTPAPTPTPKTPKTTPKTMAPQTVVEETPEETKEEPQEEVIEEAPEEVPEETPEVPEAFAPAESEDSIKAKIIALISTVIVAFSGLIIWAAIRLYRINKFEKIYRDALKRSHEIRKSGITRAG